MNDECLMTNDEGMTNSQAVTQPSYGCNVDFSTDGILTFDIGASFVFRHSSFVIRHFRLSPYR